MYLFGKLSSFLLPSAEDEIFHESHFAVLEKILDTFYPVIDSQQLQLAIDLARKQSPSAADLTDEQLQQLFSLPATSKTIPGLAEYFGKRLAAILPPLYRSVVPWVLRLMTTTIGTGFLSGGRYCLTAFVDLGPEERLDFFMRWSTSPIGLKRLLLRLLVRIGNMSLLGKTVEIPEQSIRSNPFWPMMGYPGPDPDRETRPEAQLPRPKAIPLLKASSVLDISVVGSTPISRRQRTSASKARAELWPTTYDAVIVGSGAGGGVMAAKLAEAGLKVLVCEKGKQVRGQELTLQEEDAYDQLFEQKGLVGSAEGSIGVFAGSTLGGGTAVNWSASLRTPDYVREEWSREFGLTQFTSSKFQESMERVCERIGVTTDGLVHNQPNQLLMSACKSLGISVAAIPQNTGGKPHACGWCGLGCPTDVKQGSHQTFLQDAARCGAEFLCECTVIRILRSGAPFSGVEAKVDGRLVHIQSRIVVVSAGSLHSPALLLRSGFTNPNIGANLRLHPVAVAIGYFPEKKINLFEGSIMTSIATIPTRTDPFYGPKIETPVGYPMVAGACLPFEWSLNKNKSWFERSVEARMSLLRFSYLAAFIVLQRDRDSEGRITLDAEGKPIVSYSVSKHDAEGLTLGLHKACDMLWTQGAQEIYTSVDATKCVRDESTDSLGASDLNNGTYQTFIHRLTKEKVQPPFNTTLFSAHQMGSCRLGVSPDRGACRPTGQLWESEDVWVCDGSLLPTASGVNPMVTILAVSDLIAEQCKTVLLSQTKH